MAMLISSLGVSIAHVVLPTLSSLSGDFPHHAATADAVAVGMRITFVVAGGIILLALSIAIASRLVAGRQRPASRPGEPAPGLRHGRRVRHPSWQSGRERDARPMHPDRD